MAEFAPTGMDKQMHTCMTLVDLQEAFDTLSHEVLLEKMKCSLIFAWFESYLSNRKFLVCITVFSETGASKHGVPQGSILRLLLISDLPQSLSDAGRFLFVCR